MSDTSDALWAKLDAMHRDQHETKLSMERLAGEMRTSNAELKGQVNTLNTRVDQVDRDLEHHKVNDRVVHTALETVTDGLSKSTARIYGFAGGISAAVSILVSLFKLGEQ